MNNDPTIMTIGILQLVAAIVTALATAALAVFGILQLRQIAINMRVQGEREKKWATIKACERYDSDPAINHYVRAIWAKSQEGTDYTKHDENLHDVIGFLNYLDSLSIGIYQGVYNEQIVSDHMRSTIYKAVKVFIKGESGEVDGRSWKTNKPLLKPDGFPCLIRLYESWFKSAEPKYQDKC